MTRARKHIVCIDDTGTAVVVELKCGFRGYFLKGNDRMLHEYKHLSNAPRNQHMLQLAITCRLFALTYPGVAFRGLLIRSEEKGVEWQNLERNIYKESSRALQRMKITPDWTEPRPAARPVIKKRRVYVPQKKSSAGRTMPVRRRRRVRKK